MHQNGFTRTLNFAVGEQSQSVVITLVNDAPAESTETMFLRLFSAMGATISTKVVSITILDDDQALPERLVPFSAC